MCHCSCILTISSDFYFFNQKPHFSTQANGEQNFITSKITDLFQATKNASAVKRTAKIFIYLLLPIVQSFLQFPQTQLAAGHFLQLQSDFLCWFCSVFCQGRVHLFCVSPQNWSPSLQPNTAWFRFCSKKKQWIYNKELLQFDSLKWKFWLLAWCQLCSISGVPAEIWHLWH